MFDVCMYNGTKNCIGDRCQIVYLYQKHFILYVDLYKGTENGIGERVRLCKGAKINTYFTDKRENDII